MKNGHGVEAANSSPMKSIGTCGPVSSRAASAASAPSDRAAAVRSPPARLPTWSWFWMLATHAWLGMASGTGRPWSRPRKVERVPSWK